MKKSPCSEINRTDNVNVSSGEPVNNHWSIRCHETRAKEKAGIVIVVADRKKLIDSLKMSEQASSSMAARSKSFPGITKRSTLP